MASQITACQRRKQFITPLKGASLCWLFVLVCSLRNDTEASGSFFPSFFRDFTLLFSLHIVDFSLLSARGREGFGSGDERCNGIVTAVAPPDGGWHFAYELSLTYKSICNNKTKMGSHSKSFSEQALHHSGSGEPFSRSPGEACCFNLGLPSAAKLKHRSALAFCLQDFAKFGWCTSPESPWEGLFASEESSPAEPGYGPLKPKLKQRCRGFSATVLWSLLITRSNNSSSKSHTYGGKQPLLLNVHHVRVCWTPVQQHSRNNAPAPTNLAQPALQQAGAKAAGFNLTAPVNQTTRPQHCEVPLAFYYG